MPQNMSYLTMFPDMSTYNKRRWWWWNTEFKIVSVSLTWANTSLLILSIQLSFFSRSTFQRLESFSICFCQCSSLCCMPACHISTFSLAHTLLFEMKQYYCTSILLICFIRFLLSFILLGWWFSITELVGWTLVAKMTSFLTAIYKQLRTTFW